VWFRAVLKQGKRHERDRRRRIRPRKGKTGKDGLKWIVDLVRAASPGDDRRLIVTQAIVDRARASREAEFGPDRGDPGESSLPRRKGQAGPRVGTRQPRDRSVPAVGLLSGKVPIL